MTAYHAPLADMRFVLNHVIGLETLAALPECAGADPELVEAVLEEAGRLAAGEMAPLNRLGDCQGAQLQADGTVRTPPGFAAAWRLFVAGGWNGLPCAPEYGGQGLPWLVGLAVQEIWQAANMAFALCPMLNQGAVELLEAHADPALKARYLPKMVSGVWTGTMNLTEPAAGSDLAAIRSRARPEGEHYRITGQKIFITYGEHDLAENIIHLVLARLPDAPAGTRGLSLFLVPKFLPDAQGNPGVRNDLKAVSLERKLGIHASPTAVMSFGDQGGAIGWLVGAENRGLEGMFTMMNNARLSVGLQGVAIAERAWQQARAYARERIQGRAVGAAMDGSGPILHHPDVRRMLMTMKALTEAGRALVARAAWAIDVGRRHPDRQTAAAARASLDLLTPVVKGWCTDMGCEVASLGVQVHGGMGFIEETGAAQHYRDARIAPIYEGTNGIQAADLVFRKLARDGGAAARAFLAEMMAESEEPQALPALAAALKESCARLERATGVMVARTATAPAAAAATAFPYLHLFGYCAGGMMLARSARIAAALRAAGRGDPDWLEAKIITARFYLSQILPRTAGLLPQVTADPEAVLALAPEQF